jgi:hypothetical protein
VCGNRYFPLRCGNLQLHEGCHETPSRTLVRLVFCRYGVGDAEAKKAAIVLTDLGVSGRGVLARARRTLAPGATSLVIYCR